MTKNFAEPEVRIRKLSIVDIVKNEEIMPTYHKK